MFVGLLDKIVDYKDNRWVHEQLGEKVVKYKELELDHNSFIIAEDMSFCEEVLEVVKQYNPPPKMDEESLKK